MLNKTKEFNTEIAEQFLRNTVESLKGVEKNACHPQREPYLRFASNAMRLLGCRSESILNLFMQFARIEKLGSYLEKNLTREIFAKDHFPNEIFRQSVYITAHFGAYKLINHYLILEKCVSICLVVSLEAKKTYKNEYYQQFNKLKHSYGLCGDFIIVSAEEPNLIFTLKRYYNLGYSFLFYMDGNTGTGGNMTINKNMEKINFCGSDLLVRKGMPYIAKLFNLPIVPIFVPFNENFSPVIKFSDPILPDSLNNNTQFATYAIRELWNAFEKLFVKMPFQWQGLNFIDSFILTQPENRFLEFSSDDRLIFNSNRFHLIKSDNTYIFDLEECKKIAISAELFSFFDRLVESDLELSISDFGEPDGLPLKLLSFLTCSK